MKKEMLEKNNNFLWSRQFFSHLVGFIEAVDCSFIVMKDATPPTPPKAKVDLYFPM